MHKFELDSDKILKTKFLIFYMNKRNLWGLVYIWIQNKDVICEPEISWSGNIPKLSEDKNNLQLHIT